MSGGPIKAERDAWKPKVVSTPDKDRVCFARTISTTYCGRAPVRDKRSTNWDDVTCADCHAAHRADLEAAHG